MSELARDLLMVEFLSWISSRRRTYADAMEAWQSHCPRHTIWEDAVIEGYIEMHRNGNAEPELALTDTGRALLEFSNGRK